MKANPSRDTIRAVQLLVTPTNRARVAKLTQLLLTGHGWKAVKRIMLLSHEEFSELLDAAVYWMYREASRADPGSYRSAWYCRMACG
jgi:hypothetical protein